MVANITTGKDVYGALAYNQEKVDRGDGKVLLTHIVREPADGRFNVAATAEDLLRWMPSHYRTEKIPSCTCRSTRLPKTASTTGNSRR